VVDLPRREGDDPDAPPGGRRNVSVIRSSSTKYGFVNRMDRRADASASSTIV
jgi:hypothetical protein